jgi:hypothetical protein
LILIWFVMLAFAPLAFGPASLLVTLGLICLIAGLVLVWRRPSRRLGWMAVPFVASELLAASTYIAPGKLTQEEAGPILMIFLLAMLALVPFFIWRARGYRPAATALGIAGLSYSLVASFFAAMAFTGSWI